MFPTSPGLKGLNILGSSETKEYSGPSGQEFLWIPTQGSGRSPGARASTLGSHLDSLSGCRPSGVKKCNQIYFCRETHGDLPLTGCLASWRAEHQAGSSIGAGGS
jgi:hypothetical protein